MIFVDTNYFLRLLMGDNAKQQLEAKQLFKQGAAGKENVLKLDFVKWENEKLLRTTLEIFKHTGLDLEDSYNLIYAREMKAKKFKTFDLKLIREFETK